MQLLKHLPCIADCGLLGLFLWSLVVKSGRWKMGVYLKSSVSSFLGLKLEWWAQTLQTELFQLDCNYIWNYLQLPVTISKLEINFAGFAPDGSAVKRAVPCSWMERRREGEEASEWQLCCLPAEAELVHALPFETNLYATSWDMVWEAGALLTLCLVLAESPPFLRGAWWAILVESRLSMSLPSVKPWPKGYIYGSSTYCLTR